MAYQKELLQTIRRYVRELYRVQDTLTKHAFWYYFHLFATSALGVSVVIGLGAFVYLSPETSGTARLWLFACGLLAAVLSVAVSQYANHLTRVSLRKRQRTQALRVLGSLNSLGLELKSELVCTRRELLREAQQVSLEILPLGANWGEEIEFRLFQSTLETVLRQCTAYR